MSVYSQQLNLLAVPIRCACEEPWSRANSFVYNNFGGLEFQSSREISLGGNGFRDIGLQQVNCA